MINIWKRRKKHLYQALVYTLSAVWLFGAAASFGKTLTFADDGDTTAVSDIGEEQYNDETREDDSDTMNEGSGWEEPDAEPLEEDTGDSGNPKDGSGENMNEDAPEDPGNPEEENDPEESQKDADDPENGSKDQINEQDDPGSEAEDNAGSKNADETEEEREGFVFPEASAEELESLAEVSFDSMRLIVAGKICDPEHVLSEYEGVYLLQYEDMHAVKLAYLYYSKEADFVDVDTVIFAADDSGEGRYENVQSCDNDETIRNHAKSSEMDKSDNPLTELGEAIEADAAVKKEAQDNPGSGYEEPDYSDAIALIDTGVDENTKVIASVSMLGDDGIDRCGHGTLMAERILAENPDAKILSIKALFDDGSGDVSAVYAAICYAIEKDVSVINLSMSAAKNAENAALSGIIKEALEKGIVVVASAGNNGRDAKYYVPASIEGVTTIGACDENGERVESSNYGECVNFNVVAGVTSVAAARYSGLYSIEKNVKVDEKTVFAAEHTPADGPDDANEENGNLKADALTYRVRLYCNDGTDKRVNATGTYTTGTSYNLVNRLSGEITEVGSNYIQAVPNFAREGYVFKGWNTKADGSGKAFGYNKDGALMSNASYYSANTSLLADNKATQVHPARIRFSDSELSELYGVTQDNRLIALYAQWQKRDGINGELTINGITFTNQESAFGRNLTGTNVFIPSTRNPSAYGVQVSAYYVNGGTTYPITDANGAPVDNSSSPWSWESGSNGYNFVYKNAVTGARTVGGKIYLYITNRAYAAGGEQYNMLLIFDEIRIASVKNGSNATAEANTVKFFTYVMSNSQCKLASANAGISAHTTIKLYGSGTQSNAGGAGFNPGTQVTGGLTLLYFNDLDNTDECYTNNTAGRMMYATNTSNHENVIAPYAESVSIPKASIAGGKVYTRYNENYIVATRFPYEGSGKDSDVRITGGEETGLQSSAADQITPENPNYLDQGLPYSDQTYTAFSYRAYANNIQFTWRGASCTTAMFESPSSGQLRVQKTSTDTGALSGAEFGIFTDQSDAEAFAQNPDILDDPANITPITSGPIATLATDSTGYTPYYYLIPGTYYVAELSAPTNGRYVRSADVYEITVGSGGTYTVTVDNPPVAGKIIIEKRSSLTDEALRDAEFTVYQKNYSNNGVYEEIGTAMYQTSGTYAGISLADKYTFDVTYDYATNRGEFAVQETGAPDGYLIADTGMHELEPLVNDGQALTLDTEGGPLVFPDPPFTGTVTVVKKDNKDTPLEGAWFTLYEYNGTDFETVAQSKETGSDGTATFSLAYSQDNLGRFAIAETQAPEGYELTDAAKRYFELTADGQTVVSSYRMKDSSQPLPGGTWLMDSEVFEESDLTWTDNPLIIDLTIRKTVYAKDLHEEHGAPNFAFQVTGATAAGEAKEYYALIDFIGASVNGATCTLETTITIPVGTYTVTELETDRYSLTDIEGGSDAWTVSLENAGSPVNGIQPKTGYAFATLTDNDSVTFTNRKTDWGEYSDMSSVRNHID